MEEVEADNIEINMASNDGGDSNFQLLKARFVKWPWDDNEFALFLGHERANLA